MPLYHKGSNPHSASSFSTPATTTSANPQDVDAMSPSRASLYYLRSPSNDRLLGNSTTSISRNSPRSILHLYPRYIAFVGHGDTSPVTLDFSRRKPPFDHYRLVELTVKRIKKVIQIKRVRWTIIILSYGFIRRIRLIFLSERILSSFLFPFCFRVEMCSNVRFILTTNSKQDRQVTRCVSVVNKGVVKPIRLFE